MTISMGRHRELSFFSLASAEESLFTNYIPIPITCHVTPINEIDNVFQVNWASDAI